MNEEAYDKAVSTLRVEPDSLAEALVNELDALRHFRKFCPSVTGVVTDMDYPKVTVGDTVLTINEGSVLDYAYDWEEVWELDVVITVWHDGNGLAFDCEEGGVSHCDG